VRIDVKKADICGISTPGVLKVKGGEVSVDFKPVAENLPLEPAVKCLWGEKFRGTGTLDLEGHIRGTGKPEQLLQSLKGHLNYDIRKGRIYQDIILTNVLSFLNITEILMGRFPHFAEEGFAYHSITLRSKIKENKILVQEGTIDGEPADIVFEGELDLKEQNMDLIVLVSPVKTANWIIRHTPIVRRIMGNTLITVAVEIKGPVAHPEVHALPASAVGGGLIGMMKRTVMLPFDLIHANPSQEKK